MTLPLVQVLPPGPGGVADFACCLVAHWQAAGRPSLLLPLAEPGAADRLAAALPDGGTLVVHFSGYGYAPRGLCDWLVDAVQALRARPGVPLRVVTVFHELYAVGPPWRSAFWTSAAQQRIAIRLAASSDTLWTNTQAHARWLAQHAPARPLLVRPVFSNIGEPAEPPAFAARERTAVVFGSAVTRQRAFDALARCPRALRALPLESLTEIGPGAPSTIAPGLPPRQVLGALPPAALRDTLQRAAFGVLDYPGPLLGKSGVFAALVACGCVAINTDRACAPGDGLTAGREYLALDGAADDAPDIAARALAWYAGHRAARQAQELLDLCGLAAPRTLEATA
jgi:hypothetical protein